MLAHLHDVQSLILHRYKTYLVGSHTRLIHRRGAFLLIGRISNSLKEHPETTAAEGRLLLHLELAVGTKNIVVLVAMIGRMNGRRKPHQ